MQILLNVLHGASLFALIALSFRIPFLVTGFFNIAHATVILFGAYIAYISGVVLDLHWALVLTLIVPISGGIYNVVLYRFFFERPAETASAPWQLLVLSIGVYVLGQNVAAIVWGDNILIGDAWQASSTLSYSNHLISTKQIALTLICLGILFMAWLMLQHTQLGKKIELASENSYLAELLGIETRKVLYVSVCFGGVLANLAGALIFLDIGISPTSSFPFLLNGVVSMILGGLGNVRYLFLGAFTLSTAQNLVAYCFSSSWMTPVTFATLVLFLIARPLGFSGKKIRKTAV